MSHRSSRLARAALPIIVFTVLTPLLGGTGSCAQSSQNYNPANYVQNYRPYTQPFLASSYPTQGSMDKSIMSNYGAGETNISERQAAIARQSVGFRDHLSEALKQTGPLIGLDLGIIRTVTNGMIAELLSVAKDDENLGKEYPAQTLSTDVGWLNQGGSNTYIFPNATYSNGVWGTDVSAQAYSRNLPGYGFAVKYYPGPQRQHFSDELIQISHAQPKEHTREPSYVAAANILKSDLQAVKPQDDSQGGEPQDASLVTREDVLKLQGDYGNLVQSLSTASKLKDDFVRTLVDYSTGFQTSVYALGRVFYDKGLFAAQGVSVGQLVPLKGAGLGRAAVTLSTLAQTVQFYSQDSSVPSGADAQYGFALVLQDQANGFDDHKPKIHLWHTKIGYEYYSKTFGGKDSHDYFLRLRTVLRLPTVGPTPVEIKPYIGWAGQDHKQYTGVDVGITFPLPF